MSQAAPYYRVPVVIFAVIVGGLYVYAKSGGRIYPSRTHVTPAKNSNDDAALPTIEFYDPGSDALTSFDPEPPQPWNKQPEQSLRPVLLPGSKSPSAMFEETRGYLSPPPPSLVPGSDVPSSWFRDPANHAEPSAQPKPRAVLPGSKSRAVVEPAEVAPPPPTNNAAPRSVLPGSKSAGVVGPSTFTPSNAAPQQQAVRQRAEPRAQYPVQRAPDERPPKQPRNNTNNRGY